MNKSALRNRVSYDLMQYCNELLTDPDYWQEMYFDEEIAVITNELEVKYVLAEEKEV